MESDFWDVDPGDGEDGAPTEKFEGAKAAAGEEVGETSVVAEKEVGETRDAEMVVIDDL